MGKRGPKPSNVCRRGHHKNGHATCLTCRRERQRAPVPKGAIVLAGVNITALKAWTTRRQRYGASGGNKSPILKTECRYGHSLTPDNLYWKTNKAGIRVRQCKTCNRRYEREVNQPKRRLERQRDKVRQQFIRVSPPVRFKMPSYILFSTVKSQWKTRLAAVHPDKGGSATEFRQLKTERDEFFRWHRGCQHCGLMFEVRGQDRRGTRPVDKRRFCNTSCSSRYVTLRGLNKPLSKRQGETT